MKKSSYILKCMLLLGFVMISNTSKAQWHKWHFGGGAGSLTYHGDLSDKFVNANLQEFGYHAFVERLIAKRTGIYWRLESVNGHLLGSDRAPGGWLNATSENFDRSLNFRTRIHDVNTSLVFYFGNKSKRDRPPFLNAYVRAGIGVGYFDVFGDLKDANGNFYNYWSDQTLRDLPQNAPNASDANVITRDNSYETNLTDLGIEKSFNRFKWQIPVGLGLKMRLGDAVSLVLDAQYTYAMTDYLDNVGDGRTQADITNPSVLYAADPAGFIGNRPRNLDKPVGLNDGYLYVSAGLSFNVGKNEKPKFKSPVYYPKNITVNQPDTIVEEQIIIVHPLDSVANTIGTKTGGGLIETDTTTTLKKTAEDSLFLNLIQQNYRIWLAQDTLMDHQQVDSISLIKIPAKEDNYFVQYFGKADSIASGSSRKLLKMDTIQFDRNQNAIIRDSIPYTSAQTIVSISKDTMIPVPVLSIDQQVDSVAFLIQQLRLQLDNLEKQILKDSVKLNPATPSSISDTSKKALELKRDTTMPQQIEKKTDSSYLKALATDSLSSAPANYAMVRDSVRKDSLSKTSVPKDSVASKSITATRTTTDTSLGKPDTLKPVVIGMDTTGQSSISQNTEQRQKDSLQLYQLQQAEIKRQIEELQKQLGRPGDTSRPVVETQVSESDTTRKETIEDLKKRIAELEGSSGSRTDSSSKTSVITTGNYRVAGDILKAEKDSVVVKNPTPADTSNKRLEELKRRIVEVDSSFSQKTDAVKVSKDTLKSSIPVSVDSSYNSTIEDLKKRMNELENAPRQTKDTLKAERQLTSVDVSKPTISNDTVQNASSTDRISSAVTEKRVRLKRDSVGTEKDTSNVNNSADSSYSKRIEDLKKRIDELKNAPQQAKDTVKSESRSIPAATPPSGNDNDTVRNSASAARMAPVADVPSGQDEELRNRIAELEKQLAQQKTAEDSLNRRMNTSASARPEPSPAEKQQEELQRRMTELENQLKTNQNASTGSTLTPQEKIQYQTRIDSLNRIIAMQRQYPGNTGFGNYPTYSAPQQQGIQPVIEPVISIPLNSGNGRERRESRRARKAAEKESRLESQSEIESESDTESQSEKTSRLSEGGSKDKGPGYFQARKLKKEEQSSSEENEVVSDSSEIVSDSLGMAVADSNEVSLVDSSVDSTLQAENLWLKDQIKDIQKNQDSLLSILSNLLTKVAEPVAQPEPVVVEKEVKPEIDSAKIIDGILSQPSTKVFFAVGKSALGNQYKTGLDQLANQMKNHPELKVELKGFADPTGNAAANMLLSEKRAQSVKTYLLQVHSISTDRITVLPVGQEENSSDLSYSRRVEVKLVR